jgi:WXXGXW repeat (2 copies)
MLKFVSKRVHLMLFAGLLGFTPLLASADVSITVAPPVIPVYDQPPCPGDGYLWTPGYWAWGDDDYYWVPGVWVLPPEIGFLWTPGWWGWGDGGYFWHTGYWGPHVGFYGGINYGFGYFGAGFWGGHWEGGHFFYNTACWHVGAGFHNTYSNHSWVEENRRVSFNGPGGIDRRPTAEEERAAHEGHHELTEEQRAHEHDALHDHAQKFSENKGNPGKTAQTKTAHETEHKGAEH